VERARPTHPLPSRRRLFLFRRARVADVGEGSLPPHGRVAAGSSADPRQQGIHRVPQGQAALGHRPALAERAHAGAHVQVRVLGGAAPASTARRLDVVDRPHGRVPPRAVPRGLRPLLHIRDRDTERHRVLLHAGAQLRLAPLAVGVLDSYARAGLVPSQPGGSGDGDTALRLTAADGGAAARGPADAAMARRPGVLPRRLEVIRAGTARARRVTLAPLRLGPPRGAGQRRA
jgi:hypothetical protein